MAPYVVIHRSLVAISHEQLAGALKRAGVLPGTPTILLDGNLLNLDQLAELDWAREHAELSQQIDARLLPVIRERSDAIHYFGMPPIPLGVELGRRLGPTRALRTYQQHHETKEWGWSTEDATVAPRLEGVPAAACLGKGSVIVRVSCSHAVSADDCREVEPYAIGELHVVIERPHEDALRSHADVTLVAAVFGQALDCVRRLFPNCDVVHLFAAVPPALSVRLGAEINPTIHRPVQTHQFSNSTRPRYRRAVLVGDRPRPPLRDNQREAAARGRTAFAAALGQIRELCSDGASPAMWLEELLGLDAVNVPTALRAMGPLGQNPAILDSCVALDRVEANGEFRYLAAERVWVFDDSLLAALAVKLEGAPLELAGRLFLLHEAIHVARQGVTSANAERLGQLWRVLEEVDYLADVWALLHEYGRALRIGEATEANAPQFFRELLRVVTATFWAFDAGDTPRSAIQVRRLNRYLSWYWQRLRLERVRTLQDVLGVLSTKPVLEIAGPRVFTARNRVVFDLDPAYFDAVELGVLVDGHRVERIGSRPGAPVARLLEALRGSDETLFEESLRGVFESVR